MEYNTLRSPVQILEHYNVDPEFGFLPNKAPLKRLPSYYDDWEKLADQMSSALGAGVFRKMAERMPILSIDHLKTSAEQERGFLLLSMFGHSFQWENPDGTGYLPECIAVPWAALAEKLERPAILMHGSLVLQNWRLLDESKPLTLDNITTNQQFLGGMDEAWFYLVTVAMEKEGAPAIAEVIKAQQAVEADDEASYLEALNTICEIQAKVNAVFLRMRERCDPYIFYNRVRPYLASFTEVEYRGVANDPVRSYHGGSAAQSSLIQGIDAAFSIDHAEDRSFKYLQLMRKYMPKRHREFIEFIEAGPSLRAYAESHPTTKPTFDKAVKLLHQFRQDHLEIVAEYIMKQGNKVGPGAVGTGGTNPMVFLKQVRNDTV